MKSESYVVQEGIDGHVSLLEPPRTPTRSRKQSGSLIHIAAESNKEQGKPEMDKAASPRTPSSKRKAVVELRQGSPLKKTTPKKACKWEVWEDDAIKKAIIQDGEKGTNWHDVLKAINDGRDDDEARTMNSLRLHWIQILRARMASC